MTDTCYRFGFLGDMNGDMLFTITDVWLLLEVLWLLPSNFIVHVASIGAVGRFFEIDCGTGRGLGGMVFSSFAWFVAYVLFSAALTTKEKG